MRSSTSKPSDLTFWASSSAVSSNVMMTPGSRNFRMPLRMTLIPSNVLPDPAPPHTRVGRPVGRPPPVMSSNPGTPVGVLASGTPPLLLPRFIRSSADAAALTVTYRRGRTASAQAFEGITLKPCRARSRTESSSRSAFLLSDWGHSRSARSAVSCVRQCTIRSRRRNTRDDQGALDGGKLFPARPPYNADDELAGEGRTEPLRVRRAREGQEGRVERRQERVGAKASSRHEEGRPHLLLP